MNFKQRNCPNQYYKYNNSRDVYLYIYPNNSRDVYIYWVSAYMG